MQKEWAEWDRRCGTRFCDAMHVADLRRLIVGYLPARPGFRSAHAQPAPCSKGEGALVGEGSIGELTWPRWRLRLSIEPGESYMFRIGVAQVHHHCDGNFFIGQSVVVDERLGIYTNAHCCQELGEFYTKKWTDFGWKTKIYGWTTDYAEQYMLKKPTDTLSTIWDFRCDLDKEALRITIDGVDYMKFDIPGLANFYPMLEFQYPATATIEPLDD